MIAVISVRKRFIFFMFDLFVLVNIVQTKTDLLLRRLGKVRGMTRFDAHGVR